MGRGPNASSPEKPIIIIYFSKISILKCIVVVKYFKIRKKGNMDMRRVYKLELPDAKLFHLIISYIKVTLLYMNGVGFEAC